MKMSIANEDLRGMPIVVLGAGRGRRMGGPKSLMQVEGQAWWMWQDERLCAFGLRPHWVVSEIVRQEMVRLGCAPKRAVISNDSAPMFASVLVGIASVEELSRGVFLLPVDTPAPRMEHFHRILCSPVPAHPTFAGKGGHPLFLPGDWIERELRVFVTELRSGNEPIGANDLRLDKLIEGCSDRIETGDPGVVVNINDPADLDAWLALRDEM